jgi:hypothetical protein
MTHHEHNLQGKKIAFLATDMFEQFELTEPWKAVTSATLVATGSTRRSMWLTGS